MTATQVSGPIKKALSRPPAAQARISRATSTPQFATSAQSEWLSKDGTLGRVIYYITVVRFGLEDNDGFECPNRRMPKEATVFRVKSCPRCVGDLFLERVDGVHEWACLQCGHRSSAYVTTTAPPSKADLKARRFDRATDDDLGNGAVEWTKAPSETKIGLPLSA